MSTNTSFKHLLTYRTSQTAKAFAPTNIALVKYWGKRSKALNLPQTGSLSIALPSLGATTQVARNTGRDSVVLNGQLVSQNSSFYYRLTQFLDIIRPSDDYHYHIITDSNIPIAAGLASSACGFATLVKALNLHHDWQLPEWQLSVLARIGSGSACRSFWNGFVEWHCGSQADGMDSFATPLTETWPDLRVGLLIVSNDAKPISSRKAMQITTRTSRLYHNWPARVCKDLHTVKQAITNKDFTLLGQTAEDNALAMHATMLDSIPSIDYCAAETYQLRNQVQQLRQDGVEVYFTQDAGPNLKLLFLAHQEAAVRAVFRNMQVVEVF